jgi:uncharacterized coiled-coil DUF342 family protein
MARQKSKLSAVKLDEISFVGKGDNPEAHVLLLKIKPDENESNNKGDDEMTPEEIATLKKAKDDADAKVAELTKQVADLVEKASKCPECGSALDETTKACTKKGCGKEVKKEVEEEDIYKGIPEAFVKKMKEDSATIAKMQDNELTREFVAKAADVALIGKADELGDVLKSVAKHDSALADKIMGIFKTANERIAAGDLLKEHGKQDSGDGVVSAYDKIVAKAAELRKSHPELSDAQAFTKVYDEDSELRTEYLAARN